MPSWLCLQAIHRSSLQSTSSDRSYLSKAQLLRSVVSILCLGRCPLPCVSASSRSSCPCAKERQTFCDCQLTVQLRQTGLQPRSLFSSLRDPVHASQRLEVLSDKHGCTSLCARGFLLRDTDANRDACAARGNEAGIRWGYIQFRTVTISTVQG